MRRPTLLVLPNRELHTYDWALLRKRWARMFGAA
jgi:hypothetical protein